MTIYHKTSIKILTGFIIIGFNCLRCWFQLPTTENNGTIRVKKLLGSIIHFKVQHFIPRLAIQPYCLLKTKNVVFYPVHDLRAIQCVFGYILRFQPLKTEPFKQGIIRSSLKVIHYHYSSDIHWSQFLNHTSATDTKIHIDSK